MYSSLLLQFRKLSHLRTFVAMQEMSRFTRFGSQKKTVNLGFRAKKTEFPALWTSMDGDSGKHGDSVQYGDSSESGDSGESDESDEYGDSDESNDSGESGDFIESGQSGDSG